MATERAQRPDDHVPDLDELYPPEDDEPLTFTQDDIAHAVERLEAGRDIGEYTNMRPSDLDVIWSIPRGRWDDVRRNPSLLWQLVTPTPHA